MSFKDILLEKSILIYTDTRVIALVSNSKSVINIISPNKYDNSSPFIHLLNFLDQIISVSFSWSSRASSRITYVPEKWKLNYL